MDAASTPSLNLLSDPLLLALLARALCPAGDPPEAELLARRLAHLRLDETAVLGELSPMRGSLQIEEARLDELAGEERRSAADLRLFEAQSPAPAKPPRRSDLAGLAVEGRRGELKQAHTFAGEDLKAQQEKLVRLKAALQKLEERRDLLARERMELEQGLRAAAAVNVFEQLSRGASRRALGFLDELRRLLRGNTAVAVLGVICELLAPSIEENDAQKGVERARAALLDYRALFAQSSEPLPRVLEALIALRSGRQPEAGKPGVFQPADFHDAAHYRLYQLIGVLNGQSFSGGREAADDSEENSAEQAQRHAWQQILRLLELRPAAGGRLRQQALAELADLGDEQAAAVSGGAARPEALCLLLCGELLIGAGQAEAIPSAFGITLPQEGRPLRRGLSLLLPGSRGRANEQEWPRLSQLVEEASSPVEPPMLRPVVSSALCCMMLLAAKESAPQELYEAWLSESYGWPKQDFYWWTLARLNADLQLLRNCSFSANELFAVPAPSARPL